MGTAWTHAVWTVAPGREDDFIAAWSALAAWTVATYPEATGTLLRDRDRPNVFVSFGPWPDAEAAGTWRSSAGFQEHLATIRETLADIDARLFDELIVMGGPPTSETPGRLEP